MRWLALVSLALIGNQYTVGCEGCGPFPPYVAPVPDAGRADAGVMGTNDASVLLDSGLPEIDAGDLADSGVTPLDAGLSFDSGALLDGGLPSDAGVLFDAGTAFDAGTLIDSGVPFGDAGTGYDGGLGYVCTGGPTVFTTGMAARVVVGQPDFVSALPNGGLSRVNESGFATPYGVGTRDGKLFISDGDNNRVLVYDTIPTADGALADHVIGQPDFQDGTAGTTATRMSCPQNFAFGPEHLIVSEFCNSRLSFWRLDSIATGMAASFAYGQPDLVTGTANTGGLSATSIANSASSQIIGSRWFVADSVNNRVLIFTTVPVAPGAVPDAVIGQPDFVSNTGTNGLNGLGFPLDVSSDGVKIAIADDNNDRTLVYNAVPSDAGVFADVKLGGFARPPDGTNQDSPVGVLIAGGRLFVADRRNNRILVWNTIPTATDTPADVVLGQVNFTERLNNQGNAAPDATGLSNPHFMFYDGCRLFVTDISNNRVLIY